MDSFTILSHNPMKHNYAKSIELKLDAKLKKREYRLNASIDNYLDSTIDQLKSKANDDGAFRSISSSQGYSSAFTRAQTSAHMTRKKMTSTLTTPFENQVANRFKTNQGRNLA